MEDLKQQLSALTFDDLTIAKKYFDDPEDTLLKATRALFLDLGVTDEEKALIRSSYADPMLRAFIRSRLAPQLSKTDAIGAGRDTWAGAEKSIFGQPMDTIAQYVAAKNKQIAMSDACFAMLENPDLPSPVELSRIITDTDPLQVDLIARCLFVSLVETQFPLIKILAQQNLPERKEEAKPKKGKIKVHDQTE